MKKISLLILIQLLFNSEVYSKTVLYPGTFDVFHKTHYEEATNVLTKVEGVNHVVVLPVERAYYHETIGSGHFPFPDLTKKKGHFKEIIQKVKYQVEGKEQTSFPVLFNYPDRFSYITSVFSGNDKIEVSNRLRKIKSNVFDEISKVCEDYEAKDGEKPSVIVGTDILAIWKTLPGFQNFLSNVNLIVSEDPKQPKLKEQLIKEYGNSKNIQFANLVNEGIRARDVKTKLLANDPTIDKLIPENGAKFLKENPVFVKSIKEEYISHCRTYIFDILNDIIIPTLKKGTTSCSELTEEDTSLLSNYKNNKELFDFFYELLKSDDLSNTSNSKEKAAIKHFLEKNPETSSHLKNIIYFHDIVVNGTK